VSIPYFLFLVFFFFLFFLSYHLSLENAEKIGDQIAKLLEKAIVQAQKKLVEDGFMQAS